MDPPQIFIFWATAYGQASKSPIVQLAGQSPCVVLGGHPPGGSRVSDLHGQRLVHLQPHVLDTTEDLLLVASQGDSNPEKVSADGPRAGSVPPLLPTTPGPAQTSLPLQI